MIEPLQVVPTNDPVEEVTTRFAVNEQLSLAAAPPSALKLAIVVTAAGKSVAHPRSVVDGAFTVGFVLSVIVNTWFTLVALSQESVIV